MRIVLMIFALLLASCSQQQFNDTLASPADKALAVRFIGALQSGQIEAVKGETEPQLYAQTLAMAPRIKAAVPAATNYALVTVGSETNSVNGVSQTLKALNYELGSGNRWAVMQIVVKAAPAGPQVLGWHAVPFDHQPTSSGAFTFEGKGALHYLWLVAMMLSTGTILAATVMIARSKGLRRRALWAIGTLVGLGQFTLNWSTGAWAVRPLGFFLLGSAALKPSPFDAWMLSFSLPVVAVIFLVRRKTLLAANEEASFD